MRGKHIPIINMKVECPYCHKINTFIPSTDAYGKLVGAIDNVKHCEHLVNWFGMSLTSSGMKARFEKELDWRNPSLEGSI